MKPGKEQLRQALEGQISNLEKSLAQSPAAGRHRFEAQIAIIRRQLEQLEAGASAANEDK